jgi:hypothetical protein
MTRLKKDIRVAKLIKTKTGKTGMVKDLISQINLTRDAHGKEIRDIIKSKYKDKVLKDHRSSDMSKYKSKHKLSFDDVYNLQYYGAQTTSFS